MGEIKIIVSDKLDKLIQNDSDKLGIKKTEFVKSLLIQYFKRGIKNET